MSKEILFTNTYNNVVIDYIKDGPAVLRQYHNKNLIIRITYQCNHCLKFIKVSEFGKFRKNGDFYCPHCNQNLTK